MVVNLGTVGQNERNYKIRCPENLILGMEQKFYANWSKNIEAMHKKSQNPFFFLKKGPGICFIDQILNSHISQHIGTLFSPKFSSQAMSMYKLI